ncbi:MULTISPECIES: hypothetical protein [Erythrobacter]|jgi:hypothetical protein|uniref:hypothetical protein n=1 Tax=Erythrobacter TaxID=1041 RepID=UPI00082E408E|nr:MULTISPECIES: hypothetical protein [Erythrobacter]
MDNPFTETIADAAFLKNPRKALNAAATRSIGISQDGRVPVVLVPAHEYASLRALVGRAMHSGGMAEIIRDLTAARLGAHPHSPERYDDDAA